MAPHGPSSGHHHPGHHHHPQQLGHHPHHLRHHHHKPQSSHSLPRPPARLTLGDLTSGRAFDNGCGCFESCKAAVNDLKGKKTNCELCDEADVVACVRALCLFDVCSGGLWFKIRNSADNVLNSPKVRI